MGEGAVAYIMRVGQQTGEKMGRRSARVMTVFLALTLAT